MSCSEIASETICGPNLLLDKYSQSVFMPFVDEYLLIKAFLSTNYGKLQITCVQLHYGCLPPSVPQISVEI